MNNENFKALVDRAMAMDGYAHMRPVVEKELLHYDILFSLDKEGLLDMLTFQGGTSLRLCYGAQRFSEDLDFAGGRDFTTSKLIDMKTCIENYIGQRYNLEVSVKEPKDIANELKHDQIKVDKWQISVTTAQERKDLPKQKIKIDVVNVPAYTREPRALLHNYDFLPDGYSDTLILVETLDEILADKLISFVNCTKYIRHRDIWDLRWLKQKGAKIKSDLIISKISDYKIVDYQTKLTHMQNEIKKIIHSNPFYNEISRFIPVDIQDRTLKKNKFLDFLTQETEMSLSEVEKIITTSL